MCVRVFSPPNPVRIARDCIRGFLLRRGAEAVSRFNLCCIIVCADAAGATPHHWQHSSSTERVHVRRAAFARNIMNNIFFV